MTGSPKKSISNFVRSTHHQGVEVREQEITNLSSLNLNIGSAPNEMILSPELLDEDISTMSNSTSALCSQDTNSYIQVVVKKHQSKKNGHQRRASMLKEGMQHVASQTSPTPTVDPAPYACSATKTACDDAEVPKLQAEVFDTTSAARPTLYVLPHHMLFTYPPPGPTHQCACQSKTTADVGNSARNSSAFKKIIKKEFPQRSTQHEFSEQHVTSSHCTEQIGSGSKQWLQDTLSKFTLEAFQQSQPGTDKVEVYMLDRGSREYYTTTDRAPLTLADGLAARADILATRFWAELFGLPHLVLAFFTAFILQLLRSALSGAVRPLLVGSLQTMSDYLLKPTLAVVFNALLQPPLLLLHNVLASVRDALAPLADNVANFLNPVATFLRSLSLVRITYHTEKCTHNV